MGRPSRRGAVANRARARARSGSGRRSSGCRADGSRRSAEANGSRRRGPERSPAGASSSGPRVKPWVLRGLVRPVAVVWGRGWLPPLMTSRPCSVPWARSCSMGVSIPIAGWGRIAFCVPRDESQAERVAQRAQPDRAGHADRVVARLRVRVRGPADPPPRGAEGLWPEFHGTADRPPTAGSRGTPAPGVVPTGVSRGRSTGAIPPDVMRTWPDAMRRQPTGAAISAE